MKLTAPLRSRLGLAALIPALLSGQSTQSIVSGRVTDSRDSRPLAGASVRYWSAGDGQSGAATADASGRYVLPLLSPGVYRLRVTHAGYQAREMHELEVPVASAVEADFRLRPLGEVWDQGRYRSLSPEIGEGVVLLIGPDLDASRTASFVPPKFAREGLEATLSEVVAGRMLDALPLAGRDAYTLLAALPATTSDTGTARGLGLSVRGQRPSASNFLLDGIENNNSLTTGPLVNLPPEATGEYRVSSGNYAAEYGRTAGVVANAVTRAGGNRWHGSAYYYGRNEALAANTFQRNRQGIGRQLLRESRPGATLGGPLRRNSLFVLASFEHFRERARQDPLALELPSSAYTAYAAEGSPARTLLDGVRAMLPEAGRWPTAWKTFSPLASFDRTLGLARVDRHFRGGTHRLLGRVMLARLDRPEFVWTPYREYASTLEQRSAGYSASAVNALRPGLTLETRAGVSTDELGWDRPRPEVPTLTAVSGVVLPGSPAFYAYWNRFRNIELNVNLIRAGARHVSKMGGGTLLRSLRGRLTAGRDGRYLFGTYLDFANGWPDLFQAMVARSALPAFASPGYDRRYGNRQFFAFVQDSWKLRPGLSVDAGARYESFGAPRNTGGAADAEIVLGEGNSFPARIAGARLVFPQGGRRLYAADGNNAGARFGVSWQPRPGGRTLVRAAYGVFYDRPFDNLWQNLRSNGLALVTAAVTSSGVNFLEPVAAALSRWRAAAVLETFPEPLLYQPGIRDPYSQNYFAGVERRIGENLAVEVNGLGSLGRKLITTDRVNRGPAPFNRSLPVLAYRANQGASGYHGLSAVVTHRSPRLLLRAAYTWSHAIDNQSEPLAGDFFNLTFTRLNYGKELPGVAAFSRQFDSRSDRGSSDFDQRHNLAASGLWEPARGWRLSYLAAFRTGFPYSVLAPAGDESIYNTRADVTGAAAIDQAADGGRRLLSAAAFRQPEAGRQGTGGRNAFGGPGLLNVDCALTRVFALGETARATLGAHVFNVLNHANLDRPDNLLGSPEFGVAPYGRTGHDTGFPALTPLNESPRQVQLVLKVEF